MKAIVSEKYSPPDVLQLKKMKLNSAERKSNNVIVRSPLLAYFVLSYTFFWGFLVLIIVILGLLRLQTDALPSWLMPIIVILVSWMPNLAAVTVTGVIAGREGIRQLLGKFLVLMECVV